MVDGVWCAFVLLSLLCLCLCLSSLRFYPVVIHNSLAWERTELVSVMVDRPHVLVFDHEGREKTKKQERMRARKREIESR